MQPNNTTPNVAEYRRIYPYIPYLVLLGIILLFGYIRVRLLNFPLERDEGEYAYAAQLILKSFSPYQMCHTMKLPGVAFLYALFFSLFGQTTAAIHLGLLLINTASIVLMFILAKRLFNPVAGSVAAASFAFLTADPWLMGLSAHATQFVLLPTLAGLIFLLTALDSKKLVHFLLTGILLGIAFLMKQPAVFFILFALVMLLQDAWLNHTNWRRALPCIGIFVLAASAPYAIIAISFLIDGTFHSFWFWTVVYALSYGTSTSWSQGLHNFIRDALTQVMSANAILLFAIGGLWTFFRVPTSRKHALFVTALLGFSLAAVSSGLYFRPHYFLLLAPALSLLCAAMVSAPNNEGYTWKWSPALLFGAAFLFSIAIEKEYFFDIDPTSLSPKIYTTNIFINTRLIAGYIKSHSDKDDRIAIIGSEPEILFYADRLSATSYIYMYPLMESHPFVSTMQKEAIAQIEASQPKFIVFVNDSTSWNIEPTSDHTVLDWFQHYTLNYYTLVGVTNLVRDSAYAHWQEPKTYNEDTPALLVFERKD